MQLGILENILVVLLIAVGVSVIFRKLRLPVILGYIVIGAAVGPHALAWIPDLQPIRTLAEFGVVFLMFTVGLEFSLSKLISLKYSVFILGSLQVLLTIATTTLAGIALHLNWLEALVVGGVVTMSSTAIVLKLLTENLEIHNKHGQTSMGILLFQDLAVIPFLILIASFSKATASPLTWDLMIALAKGIIAVIAMLFMGRWILRPIFHLAASTQIQELFTLTVLLVTVGCAWLTNLFGLSFALGAFLAGIMLGETEFRHQIDIEIRPFRDVLLGLFFISIGMLIDISTWRQTWAWIALMLAAIMIGKTALIILLTRLARHHMTTAIRTGIILAHGGEFGFAILTLALANQLVPADYGQVILSAMLLSLAFAPILIHYNAAIAKFCFPRCFKQREVDLSTELKLLAKQVKSPILLCGYGRIGQNIALILEKEKLDYVALDFNPAIIQAARKEGKLVTYGDATHPEMLKAAGIRHAKALVICFDNVRAAKRLLHCARRLRKDIPIIVRAKDDTEFEQLQNLGADQIITETFEESLMLAQQLLLSIELAPASVSRLIHNIRTKRYALLRQAHKAADAQA